MIDYTVLTTTPISLSPWAHLLFTDLVKKDTHEQLCQSYPNSGFEPQSRLSGEGKKYSFEVTNLIINNQKQAPYQQLNQMWLALVEEIISKQYLTALGNILEVELHGRPFSVGFYAFNDGDFVEPHLDKKHKILTQLFYFNQNWSYAGGDFHLLQNNMTDSSQLCLTPDVSTSVVIPRSEQSWHCVSPVRHQARRCSLQLEIWE